MNSTGTMTLTGIDKDRSFPFILHSILENAEQRGYSHIVSWLPDTDCYFKVHDREAFTDIIMKSCFSQTRFKSFQRQINLYSFKRNVNRSSPFHGAYSHILFVRGQSELCQFIVRVKNKNAPLKPQLDVFAPLDDCSQSFTTMYGDSNQFGQCNRNEFAALAAVFSPGKPTTRMTVTQEDTAGSAASRRDIEEESNIIVDPLLNVSTVSAQAGINVLVPQNDQEFVSTLLYEPIPIITERTMMSSIPSNMSMLKDVENDIIDIFGRQGRYERN